MKYFDKIKNILIRIKENNFSKDGKLAINNGFFQFLTQISSKFGALVVMIILARTLMPELFGLYALTLSTIMIFMALSDFGIGGTLIRFISRKLSEGSLKKAKGYFVYLTKVKMFLVFFVITLLLLSARIISNNYYQKPIFLALLAGSLFILFSELTSIMKSSFQAVNQFKMNLYQESIFQVSRIILISLVIFISIKYLLSDEVLIAFIVLALAISSSFGFIFLLIKSKKKLSFLRTKTDNLNKNEKNKLNKFILAISAIALSGAFFTYIDRVMLGHFVQAEFIGYYSAAFGLVGAAIPIITISTALLPVFSRLQKKKLESMFKKSVWFVFLLSSSVFLFFMIFSPYLIQLIFGSEYLLSVNILRLFALLIFLIPMISLISAYLTAIGKPILITKAIIISTILNIILNYVLISWFLNYGQIWGVYGAASATIISHVVYISLLIMSKKNLHLR